MLSYPALLEHKIKTSNIGCCSYLKGHRNPPNKFIGKGTK